MIITKATYQQVSKAMLGDGFNRDDSFIELVKTTAKQIEGLGVNAKLAVEASYIFSRKVPREEREDLFQELALAVLKAKTKDEKLAYTIARLDWIDWWRKYRTREHYSLDSVIEDTEGNPTTLANMLVGEVEFERKMDGKLDAQRIFDKLPNDIKPLIERRLMGQPPSKSAERMKLSRWIKSEGYKLLITM